MKQPERINNIRVVKDEENPETPEVLAASLIKIGDAMEKLTKIQGGLDNDGIAALVCNMKGMREVSKSTVLLVLDEPYRLGIILHTK
jgi:hypothetical protein